MPLRSDHALPLWWTEVGEGPPLVLIHGYGANAVTWEPWLDALARRFRCITVELKGFGRAPAPRDGRWSVPDLAAPVTELVRRLDLRDATLVGHSLGGAVMLAVALELAAGGEPADSGRIGRLVSVAGAAYRQAEPPFVRLARHPRLARLGFRLVPKKVLVRLAYRTIVTRTEALTSARVEAYARPLRRPEVQRAAIEVARNLFTPELESFTARYPEIAVPLLCLWGDADPVVPAWVGRRLAAEVPRGRYVELPGCGHMVPEERPRSSLRQLVAFVDETRAG
jgi:pimeloyl-ACP methyl ester carboxylesterase